MDEGNTVDYRLEVTQGHAIESPCTTLYRPLTVTFALPSAVSEILIRRQPLFPYHTPIPAKIWGCFLCSRSVMLGSAESEMVSQYSNLHVCDHAIPQRHRQTDGRLAMAILCSS